MHARTTRGNRVGLAVLGTFLLLAGAAVVFANRGGFGDPTARTMLYPAPLDRWISGHLWVFWAVAVLALGIVLTAVRWLLVQLRTDRLARIVMDRDRSDAEEPSGADPVWDTSGPSRTSGRATEAGRTSLAATALTSAVITEVKAIPGVRGASAALAGADDHPQLWLEVTVDQNADTGSIRAALVDQVLVDVRRALEKPDMAAFLTLVVSKVNSRRHVV